MLYCFHYLLLFFFIFGFTFSFVCQIGEIFSILGNYEMCEKTYRKALLISSKHNTLENLTSITTMKAIAMMLIQKSKDGKQNTNMNKTMNSNINMNTTKNIITTIKGEEEAEVERDNKIKIENEKENETAIEMLLKGKYNNNK